MAHWKCSNSFRSNEKLFENFKRDSKLYPSHINLIKKWNIIIFDNKMESVGKQNQLREYAWGRIVCFFGKWWKCFLKYFLSTRIWSIVDFICKLLCILGDVMTGNAISPWLCLCLWHRCRLRVGVIISSSSLDMVEEKLRLFKKSLGNSEDVGT